LNLFFQISLEINHSTTQFHMRKIQSLTKQRFGETTLDLKEVNFDTKYTVKVEDLYCM
jgi:hypothetical protein